MKKYEIEFRRTSFITYTVQANSTEEAEFIAYQELVNDGHAEFDNVQVESVEELK